MLKLVVFVTFDDLVKAKLLSIRIVNLVTG